jgi:flagella synthesis protein FlgN
LTLETKALTALSPVELLPPVIDKKTELIGELAKLETRRDELLAEMGFPGGWAGMELAASTDERLAAQWSLLQKAAERARRFNTSNGELIRVRMDYNQRALTALQVALPQKANFYGPDGRIPARAAV